MIYDIMVYSKGGGRLSWVGAEASARCSTLSAILLDRQHCLIRFFCT